MIDKKEKKKTEPMYLLLFDRNKQACHALKIWSRFDLLDQEKP